MCNERQRKYYPGDRWLYAKIYASSTQCENLLSTQIPKLISALSKQSIIDKWFFIRYADPDFHIRIRFLLNRTEDIAKVMVQLRKVLHYEIDNGIISKIQYDTYNREIERYVDRNIEESESLFHTDSIATLEILYNIHQNNVNEEDRIAIACSAIDQFLSDYNYNIESKLRIVSFASFAFCREFGYDDNNKKIELNSLYRVLSKKIESFLFVNNQTKDLQQLAIHKIIVERSNKQKKIILAIKKSMQNDKTKLLDLIQSYMHMMMNRLFISHNRQYEMLVYYCLEKEYASIIARQKQQAKQC